MPAHVDGPVGQRQASLLEDRRLAIARARDRERVTAPEGVADPGGEPGP
jgi:hypothetical protein